MKTGGGGQKHENFKAAFGGESVSQNKTKGIVHFSCEITKTICFYFHILFDKNII